MPVNKLLMIGLMVALSGATTETIAADNSGLFENTVEVVSSQGLSKAYVDRDGTFRRVFANGATVRGSWTDDGNQTCFTVEDPAPSEGTGPNCEPTVARKVGDQWTVTDPSGETLTMTVVAGRN